MATATERLGEAASSAAQTVAGATDRLTDEVERRRGDLETAEHRLRALVDEYPLTCFFAAIVSGYLVGRIVTRL
jgi:hypothetical protein